MAALILFDNIYLYNAWRKICRNRCQKEKSRMQGHLVFALIDLGTGSMGAKLNAVWDVFAPTKGVARALIS